MGGLLQTGAIMGSADEAWGWVTCGCGCMARSDPFFSASARRGAPERPASQFSPYGTQHYGRALARPWTFLSASLVQHKLDLQVPILCDCPGVCE